MTWQVVYNVIALLEAQDNCLFSFEPSIFNYSSGLNRLAFRVNILVTESAWDSVANIMRLINVFPSKRPHSQGLLPGKKTLRTRLPSKVFYTGRLVESLSIIMRVNTWSTTKG